MFYGELEQGPIRRVRVRYKNPSLRLSVCHHLASLMIPNSDPRDGFTYPTLTLMVDYYIIRFLMSIMTPRATRKVYKNT